MIRTFAAADIGSNTAHLLVAATDGHLVMRVDNVNEWIPLGEIVARHSEIPKEYVDQLVLAMREFRRVAESKKADALYVFATEGMRMARNHEAVLKKIAKDTGVQVQIISPEREAELSFRGVQLDTRNVDASILFEVGGGSAQVAKIESGEIVERCSLRLGTGRVIAETGLTNPCADYSLKAAQKYVRSQLKQCPIESSGGFAVISGGVGRGLWRALHPDGDKLMFRYEIEYLRKSVTNLPLDRIISRFSVKQKRAGTLLPGSIVYLELMTHFGIEEAVVSEFGVREGAILEMASGAIKV
jgi:exopolyphosphatase / guanosine-5'-triphosphate,3'-diphosphate pyrophosphatase